MLHIVRLLLQQGSVESARGNRHFTDETVPVLICGPEVVRIGEGKAVVARKEVTSKHKGEDGEW